MQDAPYPADMVERFWAKVRKTDGCWLWQAGTNDDGYGRIMGVRGRVRLAHRVSYELEVGPIPEGLQIDHLCRVRHCVNPAHLEAVTPRENVLRGVGMGAQNAVKTHCVNGHEFTPDNIYYRERGWRTCRTCVLASNKASDQRRKARMAAEQEAA